MEKLIKVMEQKGTKINKTKCHKQIQRMDKVTQILNLLSRLALAEDIFLIKWSLSMSFASSFSIEMMAKLDKRDCDIDERKYVFINFNVENDLSAAATVTGIVKNKIIICEIVETKNLLGCLAEHLKHPLHFVFPVSQI